MKVFYHNDLDGRCAGAVVSLFTHNRNKNDFFEVDYNMDLSPMLEQIVPKEEVYFVDYSFTLRTKWVIDKLQKMNCRIIWIDHHTSSMNLIEEFPHLNKIMGIRQEGISGAALTYMYLHKKKYEDIPYAIKLVSDYDCWKFDHEPHTTYFKLGIEAEEGGYDALDDVWTSWEWGQLVICDILDRGEVIKQYIDKDNEQYRDAFSYESVLGGHKTLVVNRKTNSWIFGEKYKEYPLVCVWVFNGEKYLYSIFSCDPNVDCCAIAEQYGGGGHRGAAGFKSDELIVRKV